MDNFWRYVNERQNIWYRRFVLKQPPPWTADPVLRDYSFCNNFRQLDRGTMYAINNILTLPKPEDRVFVTMFYRLFNNPDTLDEVGVNNIASWNRKYVQRVILNRFKRGDKVYRAAYMLAGPKNAGGKPGSKIKEYCRVLNGVYKRRIALTEQLKAAPTRRGAWECLQSVKWLGPFIALQCFLDLNYDHYFHWPNDEWVYCGPGAIRGLNRMMRVSVTKQSEMTIAINQLTDLQSTYLNNIFKWPPNITSLTNDDTEYVLCEWSKYERIKEGGKRTRRFVPSTD